MQGFVQGYYRFSVWVVKIVYLNVLWMIFTVIGLGVLGLMPSTAAMFAVVRKWLMGEEDDIPIFKTFKDSFRTEFVKANILGYILLVVGYFLYIDIQFMRLQEGLFFQALTYLIIVVFVLYSVTLLYMFPVFVHFELKMRQYIKWPLALGIMHPIITLLVGAGLFIVYFVTIRLIPILFILFGPPLIAFVLTWGARLIFNKLKQKGKESEENESEDEEAEKEESEETESERG